MLDAGGEAMRMNRRDRDKGPGQPRYGDREGGPHMSYGDGGYDRSGGEWSGDVPARRPLGGGLTYGGGVSGMHSEHEMRGSPLPHNEPNMYGLERRDYHDTYGGSAINAGVGIGGFGGGVGGGMGGQHFGLGQRGMSAGTGGGHRFGKAPKGYKRSDERIRDDVCDCIMRRGDIDASEVEVSVRDGEVVLTGFVYSRADKRAIEDLIDDVMGVLDIQNQLRVGPGVQQQQGGAMAGSAHGMESASQDATGPEGATMNKKPVKRLVDGEKRGGARGRMGRGKTRS
jgi:hypothetical protein